MSNYINAVNWYDMLATNLTADSLWAAFSDVLQTAVDIFVPVIQVTEHTVINNKRWYPAALRRAIARKKCLWRKRRDHPGATAALMNYHKAELKCNQLLREYEIKREEKIIESGNAGSFYRFVNGKLSCKRGLGTLSDGSGNTITSDADCANLLNDYFTSVCTNDNGIIPPFPRAVPPDAQLNTVTFTSGAVYAAMQKLKTGGSSGPDGFAPQLFKKLSGSLAESLSLIYSSFVSVECMPRAWAHTI